MFAGTWIDKFMAELMALLVYTGLVVVIVIGLYCILRWWRRHQHQVQEVILPTIQPQQAPEESVHAAASMQEEMCEDGVSSDVRYPPLPQDAHPSGVRGAFGPEAKRDWSFRQPSFLGDIGLREPQLGKSTVFYDMVVHGPLPQLLFRKSSRQGFRMDALAIAFSSPERIYEGRSNAADQHYLFDGPGVFRPRYIFIHAHIFGVSDAQIHASEWKSAIMAAGDPNDLLHPLYSFLSVEIKHNSQVVWEGPLSLFEAVPSPNHAFPSMCLRLPQDMDIALPDIYPNKDEFTIVLQWRGLRPMYDLLQRETQGLRWVIQVMVQGRIFTPAVPPQPSEDQTINERAKGADLPSHHSMTRVYGRQPVARVPCFHDWANDEPEPRMIELTPRQEQMVKADAREPKTRGDRGPMVAGFNPRDITNG